MLRQPYNVLDLLEAMYRLSIIIPTFGRTWSLERLLSSIKRQTLSGIEVIVIDQNKSGYLEQSIPNELTEIIRIVRLPNPNASTARNIGFVVSQSPYLLFIDDDLVLHEEFCQQGVDLLDSLPQIRCLCPWIHTSSEKASQEEINRRYGVLGQIEGTQIYQIRETMSAAIFFERDYFRCSGGFDELLFDYVRTSEDQELFMRMGKRGMQIWIDSLLSVFHDEAVPGGCELRTDDYWRTRSRCVRGWAYRYRMHANHIGKLNLAGFLSLCRSTFLNSQLLKRNLTSTVREVSILISSISDSRGFLKPYLHSRSQVMDIDHLAKYFDINDPALLSVSPA